MQKAQNYQPRSSATLLEAIGGEPLAGSGFETEDGESGFSITEEAVKE